MLKIFSLVLIVIPLVACGQDGKPIAGNFELRTDATGNAWVLDTRSGELRRCWQGTAGVREPTCYKAQDK